MVSIIIPSYHEPYLDKTIESVFKSAKGEIEVIVILDGWKPKKEIDRRVKLIEFSDNLGMRRSINEGIKKAEGEFIMKLDAHCLLMEGFDEQLVKDYKPGCLMIPRKHNLDVAKWEQHRRYIDYHYLSSPFNGGKYGYSMIVLPDNSKVNDFMIDDTMMFQGSCWFAEKSDFIRYVGELNDKDYGKIGGEQIEIGLKYWLNGGQVKIDKNVWCAHFQKSKAFHKTSNRANYNLKRSAEVARGRELLTKHFLNNQIPGMLIHNFSSIIEKFDPPGWENYKL